MANFSFVSMVWSSRSSPSTTPGDTFTVVWIEWQSEEVVLGSFQVPSEHLVGHLPLWMCVS